jgi:hypothetical protein
VFTPAFTNLSNSTNTGSYYVDNIKCTWQAKAVLTGSSAVSGAIYVARLPFVEVSGIPFGNQVVLGDSGTASYVGKLGSYSSADVKEVLVSLASGTYTSARDVTSTIPFTWTTNDFIDISEGAYSII